MQVSSPASTGELQRQCRFYCSEKFFFFDRVIQGFPGEVQR